MITFAVCDDEPCMLEEITEWVSGYMKGKSMECRVRCFTDGREILECAEEFDVMLLDIQMAGLNGMETARQMRGRGFDGLVIFITILKECVFDSFEVEAFDYLIKPLEEIRFKRTMERIIKSIEEKPEKRILIRRGNELQLIPFAQVVYCEVLGRKIYLHQKAGDTIDYYARMEELEKCTAHHFFRCHRSYLVNLDYVCGLREGLVLLSEGSRIPVSRLREMELAQALLVHMKERRC